MKIQMMTMKMNLVKHQEEDFSEEELDELLLDGNFKETWGDCLYLDTVAEGLEHKIHAVTVEITETHENDAVPFYLVSVIGS